MQQRPSHQAHRPVSARADGADAITAALIAGGFLSMLAAAVLLRLLPNVILLTYLGVSLLTMLAYALDKSAARQNRWRTSERTLHLLALAGGWPGAMVAQQGLRHKTSKASFRAGFRLTVAANCAALCWLLSPTGEALLAPLWALPF